MSTTGHYVDRVGIGTLWIAAHDVKTHFTLTDVQIMESLASFTAAAISLMNRSGTLSSDFGNLQ